MKSTEKVIISFAVGIGLGAVLGILFAPEKGIDTRKRIKEGAEEYYAKVGDIVDDIKEMVLRKGQEAVENLADDEKEV